MAPISYPSWATWYKKPSYVDLKQFAASLEAKAELSPSRRNSEEIHRKSTDVPTKLALERILKNQTCSPMSLYDFYMYLKHIEYSPENLEFYVWFKNYEEGKLTSLSENHLESKSEEAFDSGSECDLRKSDNDEDAFSSGTGFQNAEKRDFESELQVNTAEVYSHIASLVNPMCGCAYPNPKKRSNFSNLTDKFRFSPQVECNTVVNDATASPGEKLLDARRAELDAITILFLIPGAPKELNIPAMMRNAILSSLQTSTSASNLKPAADHCYAMLKNCSHRNFIRLGVSNGTFETVCMATGLGIVLTIAGMLCMLVLAFASPSIHHSNRWRGLAPWPLWSIGVSLILSGLRGSCFFLLLFSRRQPLPWERFEDDGESDTGKSEEKKIRFLALAKKLMIFDRKLKVKDDNLRYLQRKIVMQSIIGGVVFATLIEIVFLSLPIWE